MTDGGMTEGMRDLSILGLRRDAFDESEFDRKRLALYAGGMIQRHLFLSRTLTWNFACISALRHPTSGCSSVIMKKVTHVSGIRDLRGGESVELPYIRLLY